jgi:ATP-dependent exoDNAse (exonuclease V) beta subunit
MSDESTRERALDPTQSFIVQAPAGSGKTELLIQRYLTLLATVDEPEQIIAITFTRKAAAEMRSRVAAALLAAESGRVATRPHEQKTARLAMAVRQRDAARGWQLSLNPERLRVDTLDALNAWLARRLPVLAGGVAGAGIAEDAAALYGEAARRTLDGIHERGETAASLAVLLGHLDNDFPRLEAMLAELLPRRDQWLPYFASGSEAELRTVLERALGRLVTEELEAARMLWPADLLRDLAPLLAHAAQHADARHRDAFAAWLDADLEEGEPGCIAARLRDLRAWRGLAHLVLTVRSEWRRRADKRLGFGPAHGELRKRLEDLLEVLAQHDELRRATALVRSLPDPEYSASEWGALAALRVVLRRASAELRIVFAERQAVDFVELALSAQAALGSALRPSELLLALDRRVRHLLVDEFQDTSHSQLRLLELLTAGWQPGDGRTLFLVGDPMQSIYRFRDADMSLFLRVKRFGVGSVRCEPLTLERNFRSAPEIVHWVNDTFARAFPEQDDIGAGAAKFTSSRAVRESDADAAVIMHDVGAAVGEELVRAVDVIEQERERAREESLAVLVRSRSHLAGLHARLRARGLDVRARGIEPASEQQVVQDLLGLTRALLHPADRIAWLAMLRAPWCGLTWQDLAALCGGGVALTVPELLRDPAQLERLSPDGHARLLTLRDKLADAVERRGAFALPEWIERTWISLDGPACLDDREDLEHAARFFVQLRHASRRGDLDDPAELEQAFTKADSAEEGLGSGGVEIMTIHRAKGLEFDTVVLLGLDREPRRESSRALYWMQRVANDGAEELVMAPLRAAGENDALCRFVQRAEEARDAAERTRLLYVATTRARRRLHLIWSRAPDGSEPSRRSLLRALTPEPITAEIPREQTTAQQTTAEQIPAEQISFEPASDGDEAVAESFVPVLRRLVRRFDGPIEDAASRASLNAKRSSVADGTGEPQRRPEFEWAGHPAAQIGTLVHAYLHRIAEAGLAAWRVEDVLALCPDFERELMLLGLEAADLPPAAARVAGALAGVLEDRRGRWILEPHEGARSELRLTVRSGAALEHVQIDRTFVADGVRWIIDFKTGAHEGAKLDAFLDAEVARYRGQLERYAKTMAAIDARPIRLALYFPLLKAFRDWAP